MRTFQHLTMVAGVTIDDGELIMVANSKETFDELAWLTLQSNPVIQLDVEEGRAEFELDDEKKRWIPA